MRKPAPETLGRFGLLALALCGFGLLALADQVGPLTTFQAGTTARADEVNQNFAALRTVINGRLDGNNLESASITAREIAPGAVASSELANAVWLGGSGSFGYLGIRTGGNAEKVVLGTVGSATDAGGAVLTRQKGDGDNDLSVYLTPPASGDGGLVNVYDGNGALAVQLQPDGDIWKTGNVAFVHPHPRDPLQQIVYMALEGPERGTYFRGTARLAGGAATIVPPESWRLVSSEREITVQVTPRGDCHGLFVESATREAIVVRELGGGAGSAAFDYAVHGLRAGFEDHRVFEPNTMFLPTKERWSGDPQRGTHPALLANGILLPDGSVDRALVDHVRAANAHAILTPPPADAREAEVR